MNTLSRGLSIGLALAATVSFAYSQSIQVSLPDSATGETGTSVSIPLTVSDLTNRTVLAYQATVSFDNQVLRATGASINGTLSEAFGEPAIQIDPAGRILVRGSGSTPLSGSGALVDLNFDVVGQPGDRANLVFLFFLFNNGDPPADLSNGRFFVPISPVPKISVTPTSHNFGDVLVDSTAIQPFVIQNLGQAALEIQTATLAGPNASEFVTQNLTPPVTILPNDSLIFELVFNPVSEGQKSARLDLTSNDSDQSLLQIPVAGNGILPLVPDIRVEPSSLDFAEVALDTSAVRALIVANAGNGDLLVRSTAVEGSDADEFVLKGRVAPFMLAPGDSQMYLVSFKPSSVGQKNAEVMIESDDPDQPSTQVNLVGTGVAVSVPQILVVPDSLDFGSVRIDSPAVKSLQISNPGNAALEVSELNLAGPDADRFTVSSTALPLLLSPGTTTDILITFRPMTEGAHTASLQIANNDPDNPVVEIPMTGSGVPPATSKILVIPDSLDFGVVMVDSSSVRPVQIANNGNAALEVTEMNVTGQDRDAFTVTGVSLPLMLDPGTSTDLRVTFQPRSDGGKQATLLILSNDPDTQSLAVPLKGRGLFGITITTTIESPQDEATVCGDSVTVEVSAVVAGGLPPFDLRCNVNGIDGTPTPGGFVVTVPVTPGENILLATCSVTDSLGASATSSDSVSVRNPQPLSVDARIKSPQDKAIISGDSLEVKAIVQVTGGVPPFAITCEINGVRATGVDSVFVATIPCVEGVLDLIARCTVTDTCGTTSSSIDSVQVICTPGSQPNFLLGVDEDSETMVVVDVNAEHPEVIELGKVLLDGESIREMEAMALDRSQGKIFIIANSKGGRLLAIDIANIPTPPEARDIPAGLIGITGSTHLDAIAVHPATGTLFGTDTETESLVKIDPSTGAVTVVGALGFGDVEGLVFSETSNPVLFGIDNDGHQLVTIDVETGAAQAVTDQKVGFRNIECLAYDASGGLLGFSDSNTDRFVTINPETGIGTEFAVLGANGRDIEGLAFLETDSLSNTITDVPASRGIPKSLPQQFALAQNYPNPFNPSTTIRFSIPGSTTPGTNVRIRIYDVLGRLVQTLLDAERAPGEHRINWDGRNSSGEVVSAGMYVYQLTAPGLQISRRMLFVK